MENQSSVGSFPIVLTPPSVVNVENQSSVMGLEVSTIVQRSKRNDLIKKVLLALRGLALLFSMLAFIIKAINKDSEFYNEYDDNEDYNYTNNKQGGWEDFDKYREYRWSNLCDCYLVFEVKCWII